MPTPSFLSLLAMMNGVQRVIRWTYLVCL